MSDDDIVDLEAELADVKSRIQTARAVFAERMVKLGAEGMRLEMALKDAYVKAGRPIPRHIGRPSDSKHPLLKAVGNLRAWALREGLSYSTVKKWAYYGHSPTVEWQTKLAREFGVPLSTWSRSVTTRPPKVRKRKQK